MDFFRVFLRQMARMYCMMMAMLVVLLQVYIATAGYQHGIYKKLHHVGHDDSYGYDDDSFEGHGYKIIGGYRSAHSGHY